VRYVAASKEAMTAKMIVFENPKGRIALLVV
jgi:hypothetical protein